MGAVYAPYLGTPKHNTVVFAYIYIRLFTHCNFAVSSGIFRYLRHFCSDVNSGYHCKKYTKCIACDVRNVFIRGAGFLAAEFSAVDFNSAHCAELKNLDSLPSAYLHGGFMVGYGVFCTKPTIPCKACCYNLFIVFYSFLWWVWWVFQKKYHTRK